MAFTTGIAGKLSFELKILSFEILELSFGISGLSFDNLNEFTASMNDVCILLATKGRKGRDGFNTLPADRLIKT